MHVAPGRVLCRPDTHRVFRNSIEVAQELSVGGIIGADKSADAVFAAIRTDQHFALDDGRRHRLAISVLGIGELLLPDNVAGLGIERH